MAAVVKSLLRGKSLLQAILAYWVAPLVGESPSKVKADRTPIKTLYELLKEAEAALLGPISGNGLLSLSKDFKKEYYRRLQTDAQCMLPSYNHQLPTGSEAGRFLALDVGGSTLRVALVALHGRQTTSSGQHSEIVSIKNFCIGKVVKDLEGMAFFEWMAERISETLAAGSPRKHSRESPLPVSLAWSFPIEYVFRRNKSLILLSY